MVTVLREAGMRFVIYTDDHEPAHTHIYGDGEARINILDVTVLSNRGMTKRDLGKGPCHRSGEQAAVHRKMGEHPWVKLSLRIVTTAKLP